jgi:hypothetical protein
MEKKPLPEYPTKYGPGILDPDVYEQVEEVVKTKSDRYGPGVLDPPEGAEELPEDDQSTVTEEAPPKKGSVEEMIAKYASDEGYVSIGKLKELLEEMPSAFDRMYSWEMQRADGPRIGALEYLLKLEKEAKTPRVLIAHSIEGAIAKARGE